MLRTLRFFLYDIRFHLGLLALECPVLAAVSALVGNFQYDMCLFPFLQYTLVLFSSALGNSSAPNALALGGRRRDIFWGIQGSLLIYGLWAAALAGAANFLTGRLGYPALELSPAALLFYLLSCWVLAVLGTAISLVPQRLRTLSALLSGLLILLVIALCIPLFLYTDGRLHLWGSLPWLIPLGLVLLGAVGEGFLYRFIQRLCVR